MLPLARALVLAALCGPGVTVAASEGFQLAFGNLERGRCEEALPVINAGLSEGDRDLYFLAGFMFSRGLCVSRDGPRAAGLLEPAAKAGHADATAELVLLHGMGRGVPQSYAQAGRWAVASMDIMAIELADEKGRATAASASASASRGSNTLDAELATTLGYLATLHALAADQVRREGGDEVARMRQSTVRVRVYLGWPEAAMQIEAGTEGKTLRDVSQVVPSGTKQLVDFVRSAYEGALKEASPLPCSRAACKPLKAAREYLFRMR